MAINTNYVDGKPHHLYVKSRSASNDEEIIAPNAALVKRKNGDPYRIRTDVNGVRGRCLNHLTNGPWCTFRDSNPGPTD